MYKQGIAPTQTWVPLLLFFLLPSAYGMLVLALRVTRDEGVEANPVQSLIFCSSAVLSAARGQPSVVNGPLLGLANGLPSTQ
jgi:hypothetical protein